MPSGKVERVGGNPGSVSRSRSHRPSVHSAVARELACELGQGNAGIPASSSSVLNGCKKTARDPGLAQGSSEAHINHHAQHVGTIPASTPPPSSLPHLPLCPSALPPTHPTPLPLPPSLARSPHTRRRMFVYGMMSTASTRAEERPVHLPAPQPISSGILRACS